VQDCFYRKTNSYGIPIKVQASEGATPTNMHLLDMHLDPLDKVDTQKWNPVTFAMCTGNLTLLKHLVAKSSCNIKQLLKVHGMHYVGEMSKLFPFYIALYRNSVEMFEYFWTELGGSLWNDE
jgi:hypothetical protein